MAVMRNLSIAQAAYQFMVGDSQERFERLHKKIQRAQDESRTPHDWT